MFTLDSQNGVKPVHWVSVFVQILKVTHSRCQRGDSQSAQHVSLVADGPQRNHVHGALSRTRQDGDVAQRYGRDFLPGSRGVQFTLPVQEGKQRAHRWTSSQYLQLKMQLECGGVAKGTGS